MIILLIMLATGGAAFLGSLISSWDVKASIFIGALVAVGASGMIIVTMAILEAFSK